jgi:hypothetical protein
MRRIELWVSQLLLRWWAGCRLRAASRDQREQVDNESEDNDQLSRDRPPKASYSQTGRAAMAYRSAKY